MYPAPIDEYHAPTELAEALGLLSRHGEAAKILAGGQSLMQQMKARLLEPRVILDLNRVRGLDGMRESGGALEIGALVRFSEAAADARVRERFTALAEAAAAIGDRQVRNRGTLVGSVTFAANYGDVAPAAAALGASVVVAGTAGSREVPIESFVRGVGVLDLAPTEIVTALRVPAPRAGSGSAYVKHGRVYQDRATIGVAAWVSIGSGGALADARIVVGGLGTRPIERAKAAEDALRGSAADAAALTKAGDAAAGSLATQTDELASAEYRTALLRVLVPQALETAFARARR